MKYGWCRAASNRCHTFKAEEIPPSSRVIGGQNREETAMRFATTALAIALSATIAGGALADQKLAPEQQTKVEAMLKQEGFTKWKEIEMDDGMIEVDDAIDASGKQFDLKIDPTTLVIKKRKAE
jgi:hypothetical protein